jgi:hypothetical protein
MTFVVGWVGVELRRRVGLMCSNLTGTRAIVLAEYGRDAERIMPVAPQIRSKPDVALSPDETAATEEKRGSRSRLNSHLLRHRKAGALARELPDPVASSTS